MSILDQNTEPRISVVEVGSLDPDTNIEETLYYSTANYVTTPTDSLANTAFEPRVINAGSLERSIFSREQLGTMGSVGVGSVELSNVDGGLDYLYNRFLIGRRIEVKQGALSGTYAALETVFYGTIEDVKYSAKNVVLVIRDSHATLDTEISSDIYGPIDGTGVETFNTSLHNYPLPVCYGDVLNVSPKYVGQVLGAGASPTFDPTDVGPNMVLSNGDLTATNTGQWFVWNTCYTTTSVSTGKYYFEVEVVHSNEGYSGDGLYPGVAIGFTEGKPTSLQAPFGSAGMGWGFHGGYDEGGTGMYNGTYTSVSYYAYAGTPGVLGMAIDLDTGEAWGSINGVWWDKGILGADPSTGTAPLFTNITGELYMGASYSGESGYVIGKFTEESLTYPAPEGFIAGLSAGATVAELIYQVHDGAITDVTKVYSNGNELLPDQYTKLLSEGKFQVLIGSVAGATITADIQGSVAPTRYNRAGDIIESILATRLDTPPTVDSAKFTALADPYFEGHSIIDESACGMYIPAGASVRTVLNEFSKSYGTYMGFNRAGLFDIGVLTEPANNTNICSYGYSSFEAEVLPSTLESGTAAVELDLTDSYFGSQSLKLSASGASATSTLGISDTDYNVPIPGNKVWIVSWYAKASGAFPLGVQARDSLGAWVSPPSIVSTMGWARYSSIIDLSGSSATALLLRISSEGGAASTVNFDGIMLEEQVEGATEPSKYSNPLGPSVPLSIVSLTEEHIESLERLPLNLPSFEHSIGYAKNYRVLTESTIAAVVPETQSEVYTFMTNQYREALAGINELGIRKSDSAVVPIDPILPGNYWSLLDRYPRSIGAKRIDSLIGAEQYAALEARRRWALYNDPLNLIQRSRLSVKLAISPFTLELNDTIHITYPRLELSQGKFFKILGFSEDLKNNSMTLEVWG